MTRRHWLLPLVLLAVAGLVSYAWHSRGERAAAVAGGDSGVAPPATRTVPALTAAAPDSTPTTNPATAAGPEAALPPPDAPLAAIADELLRRADAGDSAAACRLGAELVRCQRLADWTFAGVTYDVAEQAAVALETAGREGDAETALRVSDANRVRRAQCAMLDPALVARGPALLRTAALAGETEAMLRYADGSQLFAPADFSYLTTAEFDRWRQEAPALLQRALAAGRPEAVVWLAQAHGGGEGLLQGLIVDDPEQALRWRLLANRMFGRDADALVDPYGALPATTLDADARARAERWAAERQRQLFGDTTFAVADLVDPQLVAAYDSEQRVHEAGPVGRLCGTAAAAR